MSEFWELNWDEKKSFVANSCKKSQSENQYGDSSKHIIHYYLPLENKFIKVCKFFFQQTLDLGNETIRRMLRLRVSEKKSTVNADNLTKISLEKWLRDLPKAPSHYCRSNTSKLYLTDEFDNVQELYNEYKR